LAQLESMKLPMQKGVEVSRSEVQMPDGPMKELGEFKVLIVLHSEVSVTIEVNVIPE